MKDFGSVDAQMLTPTISGGWYKLGRMRALVRPVPASYPRCLRSTPASSKSEDIDILRAREQHARYRDALATAGVEVVALPPLDHQPDSVFVEDTAVILEQIALITRPGAPSRQAEGEDLDGVFGSREVLRMTAPATLDGGDVLRFDRFVFVGLSARTNRAGFECLRAAAARAGLEAVEVPVAGGLHLKSACSRLGEAVIGHFDQLDRAPFVSRKIALIDAPDALGANVLELGSRVLVSAAAPETVKLAGARAIAVEVDEFHKGDGALTCMSILI